MATGAFFLLVINHFVFAQKKIKDPEYDQRRSESVDYINSFRGELEDDGISTMNIFSKPKKHTLSLEQMTLIPGSVNFKSVASVGLGDLISYSWYFQDIYQVALRGGRTDFFVKDPLQYLSNDLVLATFRVPFYRYRDFSAGIGLSSGMNVSSYGLHYRYFDSMTMSEKEVNIKEDHDSNWILIAELELVYDVNDRWFIGLHGGYGYQPQETGQVDKKENVKMFINGLSFGYHIY